MIVRLNLGCGTDIREGYINCDFDPRRRGYSKADLAQQVDLNKMPWPWFDNSIDEILMWHVLEHLPDTTSIIGEVHRVLKPGGVFHGQVPFAMSEFAFDQFDHTRYFTDRSFHSMAHFGFEVSSSLAVNNLTWRHKFRNMIPFRWLLRHAVFNMYDVVNFEMRKL